MRNPNSTDWLVLPGSRLQLSYRQQPDRLPRIEITGNPRGMVSIANIFLWLASPATDYDSLSISGLSFMTVDSALSLTALLIPENEAETKYGGKLTRLDKSLEFEWQVTEQQAISVALDVHCIGCTPEKGYIEIYPSPNSDADMLFELISDEQ